MPDQPLELKKDFQEPLKVFLIFVSNFPQPPVGYSINGIVAYRQEDALARAIADNPGRHIFFAGNTISIEELMAKIKPEKPLPLSVENSLQPSDVKGMNKAKFKQALMLVLDDYTKPKDRKTLRAIIDAI